jgi:protein NrfC
MSGDNLTEKERAMLEPENPGRRKFMMVTGATCAAGFVAGSFLMPGKLKSMPDCKGFLVVDLKKCQGCGSCMMVCSLGHHGASSQSLSRIQIQQDSFANYPADVFMAPCHQCQDAPCVQACPVAANRPALEMGNVRMIDQKRCIGCEQCIDACRFTPSRVQWDPARHKAQKCDLCTDTPYLGEKGGIGGTQACVKVCPVNAISFTNEMPDQLREDSYQVDLRGKGWFARGFNDGDS